MNRVSIPVKIPVFEGPLDLLLHLIEKNKLNIYDIPIVEITDQYLAYVEQMEEENLDVISEFLIMAATLIEIKSRMLLPKDEVEEEEDPREELVRRLLEYKIYKYAAGELDKLQEEAGQVFYGTSQMPEEVISYEEKVEPEDVIGDLTLRKLNEIFQSVMKKQRDKVDPIRSKFHKIEKEEVRVEEKILSIRKQLIGLKNINFKTLLESQPSKTQVVVTFLAVLELMKMGLLRVRQEEIHGDIWMDSEEEGSVTEYGDQ
ncbi:MAG: segregation/condensation protein A [Lachnospiraceae bacterium]|nr:segregation/condensation protein A [Lachnospiraceae bacterium]